MEPKSFVRYMASDYNIAPIGECNSLPSDPQDDIVSGKELSYDEKQAETTLSGPPCNCLTQ